MEPINNQTTNTEQAKPKHLLVRLSKERLLLIGAGVFVLFVVLLSVLFQKPVNNSAQENKVNESKVLPTKIFEQTAVTKTPQTIQQSTAMEQALEEANRAASEYDTWQAENLADYPWLRKLPLADSNYYFYFDTDKKTFIGKLYPKQGENIEQTKAYILQQAQLNQIHYQDYPIQWLVNPKSSL